jgi:hypothetical protein
MSIRIGTGFRLSRWLRRYWPVIAAILAGIANVASQRTGEATREADEKIAAALAAARRKK